MILNNLVNAIHKIKKMQNYYLKSTLTDPKNKNSSGLSSREIFATVLSSELDFCDT